MQEYTNQDVYLIGKKQKVIIWMVLLLLICLVYPPLQIIVGVVYIFQIYVLAKALKVQYPWLWALGMLIPFVSLICLLSLIHSSTCALRSKGIKVGVMGANKNQLKELGE